MRESRCDIKRELQCMLSTREIGAYIFAMAEFKIFFPFLAFPIYSDCIPAVIIRDAS